MKITIQKYDDNKSIVMLDSSEKTLHLIDQLVMMAIGFVAKPMVDMGPSDMWGVVYDNIHDNVINETIKKFGWDVDVIVKVFRGDNIADDVMSWLKDI